MQEKKNELLRWLETCDKYVAREKDETAGASKSVAGRIGMQKDPLRVAAARVGPLFSFWKREREKDCSFGRRKKKKKCLCVHKLGP